MWCAGRACAPPRAEGQAEAGGREATALDARCQVATPGLPPCSRQLLPTIVTMTTALRSTSNNSTNQFVHRLSGLGRLLGAAWEVLHQAHFVPRVVVAEVVDQAA